MTATTSKLDLKALSQNSQLLFSVLSDPVLRRQLYSLLYKNNEILPFVSRVSPQFNANEIDPKPETFSQTAYLVAHPDHLETIFNSASKLPLSNSAYEGLGGH